MEKPIFTVAHRVDYGDDIALYRGIHPPFMKLMASLYPTFAAYTKAEVGYSAFTRDGTFIGCFAGNTLQSIRKNPWFDDTEQWFLRALLLGLKTDRYTQHQSVCDTGNYGTLRLWQKLGLGAKIDARGKARSAAFTEENVHHLQSMVVAARVPYADVRAFANAQMAKVEGRPYFIPSVNDRAEPTVQGNVTLL